MKRALIAALIFATGIGAFAVGFVYRDDSERPSLSVIGEMADRKW